MADRDRNRRLGQPAEIQQAGVWTVSALEWVGADLPTGAAERIVDDVLGRCFLVVVLLASASCGAASENAVRERALETELAAVIRRCGLEGHIAYEVVGKEMRTFGSDPRLHHPNYDICFMSGIEPLDLEFGWAGPRRYQFMGPPEARPDAAMLVEIEARVSRTGCVRGLARWWREYAFGWPNGRLDRRVLRFQFHEHMPRGEQPGRTIYDSDTWMVLSDAPGGVVFGSYDTVTHRLSLDHCGSNHGPLRPRLVP